MPPSCTFLVLEHALYLTQNAILTIIPLMSEFGESMDTGAPMDTAESKVLKNIVCWAHHSLRILRNQTSNLFVFCKFLFVEQESTEKKKYIYINIIYIHPCLFLVTEHCSLIFPADLSFFLRFLTDSTGRG